MEDKKAVKDQILEEKRNSFRYFQAYYRITDPLVKELYANFFRDCKFDCVEKVKEFSQSVFYSRFKYKVPELADLQDKYFECTGRKPESSLNEYELYKQRKRSQKMRLPLNDAQIKSIEKFEKDPNNAELVKKCEEELSQEGGKNA